jgi:transposase
MKKRPEKERLQIDLSTMDRAELEEFAMQNHTKRIALEAELESYKELLRKNRKDMFGSSSERYVSEGQISLFNEAEEEADGDTKEPEKYDVLPAPKQKKQKGRKKEVVSRLPKETIEYKLGDDERVCQKCGSELRDMKTVVRTEIDFTPAKYKVLEHRTKVYTCRACDKDGIEGTIVTAPSPKGMFRNSLASPGLVADIMFKKYGLAQPLSRQSKYLERLGISLHRNTMANWLIMASFLYLKPIRTHMQNILARSDSIHVDETPVQVLRESGRSAVSKSYMWMYRTGAYESSQVVLFDYSPGRGSEYPKSFLSGFRGYMHTDGYSAYRVLTQEDEKPTGIVIAGCFAHARRKYTDIIKGLKKDTDITGTACEKALMYIGDLFKIEADVKGKTADERHEYRKKYAVPIADEYFAWLKSIVSDCSGSLESAVKYSLNYENELRVYLMDGRLEISNNLGENAIRPFCVGRRNWLFSDTPNGADASAICYGTIETAKANGVDPFEYLKYIFSVFKDTGIDSIDLDDFMPWSTMLPDICKPSSQRETGSLTI